MTKQYSKNSTLMKIFHHTLVELPAPINISTMWNIGSLLSMTLVAQLITGVLLAASYSPSMMNSFNLITQTMENFETGWLIRYMHANGASLFFMGLYAHTGRGLYFGSYTYKHTWMIGVSILIMIMAAAFLGYVLPMNQMSYWGASVITNLFSEIPYLGPNLVQFIWGSTSVNEPTIMRFFTFHFLAPFMALAMVMIHITLLHTTGSNNPMGLSSNSYKIPFHPYFSNKDLMGVALTLMMFTILYIYIPLMLGDDENFTLASPAVTPRHIQPEWYFLFAYAILRSIPNKLGGVIALALSVAVLYTLPLTHSAKKKSLGFYPLNKIMFWSFVTVVILLTWIGARPVEPPYVFTGQILTTLYFLYFLASPLVMKTWDKITAT